MYVEYGPFIVKMDIKSSNNEVILKNLNALCNIKFILELPCILPMFECVCALIKIAQHWNVFVCDFVAKSIKLTQ